MRDYSKVGPKFWIGATGKRLRAAGVEAQIVAMYLLTSPHANMLGLYYCPTMFIAHETGLGLEGASKGLQRAIEAGFCEYDEASEVVWVIEMASYQIGEALKPNDLRVKGVQNEYGSLPENPYLARFYEKYSASFCMSVCRGKGRPFQAPTKPLRSQEQEQEQEQDKNAGKPAEPAGFVAFWTAWPVSDRKQARGKCLEAWKKARCEGAAAEIVAHVEAMKLSAGWRKNGGEFIPAPLVYLNGRRWEGAELTGADAPTSLGVFV